MPLWFYIVDIIIAVALIHIHSRKGTEAKVGMVIAILLLLVSGAGFERLLG